MERIQIDYTGVEDANRILRSVIRELEALADGLSFLYQTVHPEIQARHEIGERLKLCRDTVEALEKQSRNLLKTVETGRKSYQQIDLRLTHRIPPGILVNQERRKLV